MERNVFSYSFCIFASSMQEELGNMGVEEKAAMIKNFLPNFWQKEELTFC